MNVAQTDQLVRRAEEIYSARLRPQLEREHQDEFVAIEPDSGDYFLGRTLSEAVGAARAIYANRLVHTVRVGHRAAIHFGGQR